MTRKISLCKSDGCDRDAETDGLCNAHYRRKVRVKAGMKPQKAAANREFPPTKRCSIEGCYRMARTRGWCKMHYQRWLKHGDPTVYYGSRDGLRGESSYGE